MKERLMDVTFYGAQVFVVLYSIKLLAGVIG